MYPAGVQSKPGGGNFSLVRSGSEFGALWGRRLGRPGRPGCGVQARFLRLRLERANFFLFLPEGEASLIGDHSLPHWQGRNQGNSGLEDAIMLSPAFSMQGAWSPAPVDWKPSVYWEHRSGRVKGGYCYIAAVCKRRWRGKGDGCVSDLTGGTSVAFPPASMTGCDTVEDFLWVLSKIQKPQEVKPMSHGSSESLLLTNKQFASREHSNQNM